MTWCQASSTSRKASLRCITGSSLFCHVLMHIELQAQKALQAIQHLNLRCTPATDAGESPLLCPQCCCLGLKRLQLRLKPAATVTSAFMICSDQAKKYMSQTKTNGTTQSVCWAHLPGMHMLRRPKIAAALVPGVLLCPHLGHMHLLTHGIL